MSTLMFIIVALFIINIALLCHSMIEYKNTIIKEKEEIIKRLKKYKDQEEKARIEFR